MCWVHGDSALGGRDLRGRLGSDSWKGGAARPLACDEDSERSGGIGVPQKRMAQLRVEAGVPESQCPWVTHSHQNNGLGKWLVNTGTVPEALRQFTLEANALHLVLCTRNECCSVKNSYCPINLNLCSNSGQGWEMSGRGG